MEGYISHDPSSRGVIRGYTMHHEASLAKLIYPSDSKCNVISQHAFTNAQFARQDAGKGREGKLVCKFQNKGIETRL